MKPFEMSAVELSRALDRRELSSEEIVRALHDRRDAVDGKLGAFVVELRDRALTEARAADVARAAGEAKGPLHGVPVTIKENIDVEGTDATLGTSARRGRPAKQDAVVVRLLREAGAIVLGKTNVPQTLIAMETTNPIFGTTKNPWDTTRTPGGSSGGEAAAIASGQSVLGVGTDIGGSIRIPVAFCGIAGIKPTLHRWSNRGSNSAIPGQEVVRSQIGPLARTVADLVLVLRTIDTPLHARHDPEVPPLPIGSPDAIDLRGLRVGLYDDDTFFTPAESVRRAVRQAAKWLEARGAVLVPFEPPHAEEHYVTMVAAVTADGLANLRKLVGDDPVIDALKLNWRLGQVPKAGRKVIARAMRAMGEVRASDAIRTMGERTVAELFALAARRTVLQRDELDAWNTAGIDAILCPATATPAALLGQTGDFTPAAVYTTRYNVLNLPAGVVPASRVRAGETERKTLHDRIDRKAALFERGSEGLPVAVQVVGRPFREDVVLAIMAAIESDARASGEFPKTPIDPK
jgi:fatty acid amide hydrolase